MHKHFNYRAVWSKFKDHNSRPVVLNWGNFAPTRWYLAASGDIFDYWNWGTGVISTQWVEVRDAANTLPFTGRSQANNHLAEVEKLFYVNTMDNTFEGSNQCGGHCWLVVSPVTIPSSCRKSPDFQSLVVWMGWNPFLGLAPTHVINRVPSTLPQGSATGMWFGPRSTGWFRDGHAQVGPIRVKLKTCSTVEKHWELLEAILCACRANPGIQQIFLEATVTHMVELFQ